MRGTGHARDCATPDRHAATPSLVDPDELVTEAVAARCRASIDAGMRAESADVPESRLPELVGRLFAVWVRRELAALNPEQQFHAVQRLTSMLATELTKGMRPDDKQVHPPQLLRSVSGPGPEATPPFPLTPLSDTTLLTNAPGEPNVGTEITHELASSDHVDVLMAFVRWTGIRLHLEELERLIERGGTVVDPLASAPDAGPSRHRPGRSVDETAQFRRRRWGRWSQGAPALRVASI